MPESNAIQWSKEVTDWIDKTVPRDYLVFLRKLVLDALSSIVMGTRVDTGRARGGWQVTIDAPADGEIDVEDQSGNSTITKGVAALQALRKHGIGEDVYISNNVKYILDLEELDGMVTLTVQRMSHLF